MLKRAIKRVKRLLSRGEQPRQSEQRQAPDFEQALRAVAAQALAGQRGFVVLQDLPRFGVTEQELVAWLRAGHGREVLMLREWERLAAAGVEGVSAVAGEVVGELQALLKGDGGSTGSEISSKLIISQPVQTPATQSSYNPHTSQIKPEAKALYNQGVKRYKAGDRMGAIELWTQAVQLDPSHTSVFYNRGTAYYDLKQYEAAIADYSKAIEIDPRYTDAYNNRGVTYSKLKRYEEAIADYTQAIKIDPCYTDAYNGRGNAYSDLKRYEDAIADYSKAIEIDPHYIRAYNNRGVTYSDLKRYEEAITDYSQAIEIDPRYTDPYNGRGIAYKNLKRYEEAITDYDKAIKLDPKDYLSWWNRGWAKYNKFGYQAALDNWQEALDEQIKPDAEPLGCAILHWQIGKVHSYRAKDNTEYILYWEASKSHETAYTKLRN